MKLRFAFLGLLSLIAVSCSYEESFIQENNIYDSSAEFYATIDEQPDADTKVYADDQLRVLWNEDDRVTIFNKNTYNRQYRFTGQEGANAGGFRKVQSDDEFITSEPLDLIYSVYPYQETTYINYDETISFVLPAEQTYKDSSFGIGANTMVSKTMDNQLRFKNVGGYLSLKFFGEGVSISSITLKGNNGELLAGKCSIDMSSGLPILTMDNGKATDTITLVCDPAVELGNSSSEAIAFWFVLPPVTFSNGITVTVTTSDGGVFEKSTSNKLEIGRSAITKMGALEVVPKYVQPNNVIYYTSTDGEIVTPSRTDVFGATIVTNEYIDGRGVLTFDGNVTSIGGYAFSFSGNLSSIIIPDSVISIGTMAFAGSSLTSVIIPDSVVSIKDRAFKGCELTSIYIPDSVTDISGGAFTGCNSSLVSIMVDSGNPNYDSRNNCNAIIRTDTNELIMGCQNTIIPNSVTSIGGEGFSGCSGLTSIVIPDSVTSIGRGVFYLCSGLTSIVIPDSVASIGDRAFSSCFGLTSIVIPDSVTSIGSYAFSDCSRLTSIYIPDSVIDISEAPLSGCSNLVSIIIDSSNPNYDSRNNCNAIIRTDTNELIMGCQNTIIPSSVASIGEEAFSGCSGLTSIVIPDSVTSIGSNAFSGCSGLTSIVIPDSVTSIGDAAFYYCFGLESITLCAITPLSIGESVFEETNNCPVYVPAGSVEAYKSAQYWSDYADRIQAIPTPNNIIYYTSTDGNIVTPHATNVFGANIVSNEYVAGQGVLSFDGDVTSIGNYAFYQCPTLASIIIPESVTTVGVAPFGGCSSLEIISGPFVSPDGLFLIYSGSLWAVAGGAINGSIVIPESVTTISNYVFQNCLGLTEIVLPAEITSIRHYAFDGCSNLTKINIPEGVTAIPEGTFWDCSSLYTIELPEGITYIGEDAFHGCISLSSITLPKSLTGIDDSAFESCSGLTSIIVLSETPPSGGNGMFDNTNNAPIYVPSGSVDAYKTANKWKNYANRIYPISESSIPTNFNPNTYLLYRANKTGGFIGDDYRVKVSMMPGISGAKVEMKLQLTGPGPISTGNTMRDEYDYFEIRENALVWNDIYREDGEWWDDVLSFTIPSATSLLLIQFDGVNETMTINDNTSPCHRNSMTWSRLFVDYGHESDEGIWDVYSGVPDGSKLYYVKVWDADDTLNYIGYATTSVNPDTNRTEFCWCSYYPKTGTTSYDFANDAINQGGYQGYIAF